MKTVVFAALMGLLMGLIWTPVTGAGVTQQDFVSFLKDYEARVIPLNKEVALSYFNAVNSGTDADYDKSAVATLALEKFHSDPAAFARVRAFRESGLVTDSLLKRQLDIIYLSYLGSQIDSTTLGELISRETAIEQKFNTYRVKVGNRNIGDNEVDSILRYSTNSAELEETWKASKQIGREVAGEIIELVRLRNRAAQSLGFSNYYEMQLKLAEQDPAEIASLFDELDSLTRGTFVTLKGQVDSVLAIRYNVVQSDLRPWHYQNRFFQEAPRIYSVDLNQFYQGKDPVELSRKYFAGIGIPVDSILAHSDLYERPGKYQHAQNIDIDRAGDTRIVCSVRPDYYWMNTMLHELGHGVYDYYGDRQAPWLLRGAAHSLTTEAIAMLFGRLSANPQWLVKVAGVPKSEIDKVADDCARMLRLDQIVFSRFVQVMLHFERALYENPDQNLNKLWWDLVERYQGLTRLEGREEPDWASKIHIATAPVYYHNYLMGELLASQLIETIGRKVLNAPDPFTFGFAGDPRVGKFLVENVFLPGARYPWNEMIRRATGEKLTSKYYARQFVETK
ncbi:MAG: M2 family metallopeptidase [candidate division Zixibacteria bacterium]|nr:M2 family metallopeptidase [candidate division Zixibacteria bacterium]